MSTSKLQPYSIFHFSVSGHIFDQITTFSIKVLLFYQSSPFRSKVSFFYQSSTYLRSKFDSGHFGRTLIEIGTFHHSIKVRHQKIRSKFYIQFYQNIHMLLKHFLWLHSTIACNCSSLLLVSITFQVNSCVSVELILMSVCLSHYSRMCLGIALRYSLILSWQ